MNSKTMGMGSVTILGCSVFSFAEIDIYTKRLRAVINGGKEEQKLKRNKIKVHSKCHFHQKCYLALGLQIYTIQRCERTNLRTTIKIILNVLPLSSIEFHFFVNNASKNRNKFRGGQHCSFLIFLRHR